MYDTRMFSEMSKLSRSTTKALKIFIFRFIILYGGQTLLSILQLYLRSKSISLETFINLGNLKFASSIAGLTSSYRFWIELLGNLSSTKKVAVAGALAAPMLLIDDNKQRSAMIAQAIFTRTLYFMIRVFVYESFMVDGKETIKVRESNNVMLKTIRKVIHKCGDWIVWFALAYRVCYASWVTPELLRKNYYDQLVYITGSNVRMGREAKHFIQGATQINNVLEEMPFVHKVENIDHNMSSFDHYTKHLNNLAKNSKLWTALDHSKNILKHLPKESVHHDNLSCLMQHPWQPNCTLAALGIAKDVFKVTLPIFTKLNGASLVLSISKMIYKSKSKGEVTETKRIKNSFFRAILATLRSSLMLTAFISIFSLSVCQLRSIFGRARGTMYGLAGLIAAPTILIDKPGRLLEFNTFLVAKTLEQLNIGMYRMFGLRYNRLIC